MKNPHTFIIIKGKPKALEIEKIWQKPNGLYEVKFTSSSQLYNYRHSDVVILDNAEWHDYLHCKVFVGGVEQQYVTDIRSYRQGSRIHWRITFSDNLVNDYLDGTIQVVESCLADSIAKNEFEYLKRVAQINELGKDEEHGGILPSLYEKLYFIDETLAIGSYLRPWRSQVYYNKVSDLVFPFGCNASQGKAIVAAFENQISVIQGPPGTGKTQTILNIIANIIMQGKTVMVVSNNNSATTNVLEKLQKYGLDFIVAPLGKRENKEIFIKNQPLIPQELQTWQLSRDDVWKNKHEISSILSMLQKVYVLQEELASCKQELKDVDLEWRHFKQERQIDNNTYSPRKGLQSKNLMNLWLRYQAYAEGDIISPQDFFGKIKERIIWIWMNFMRKHLFGIKTPFNSRNLQPTIQELQAMYYMVRLGELQKRIDEINVELSAYDAKMLASSLTSLSMALLKHSLNMRYGRTQRRLYSTVKELRLYSAEFKKHYPVILSTTFSARTSLPDEVFDYIIMDEASQVSIETGALALTCAKNAVIVGDTLQLPNVVTQEDKQKLTTIFEEFKVLQGYNCAKYSFLQSVCIVLPQVKQTLLREHYRCHPKIINFCNQRFYGGNLLIMTEDNDENDVMSVVKTVPGNHARGHFNQREIDVVKEEVLPHTDDNSDLGIIAPYNSQVDEFNRQLSFIEAATIHKYQGREKDTIIMSVVDDQITDFCDDPNLLNVAISRAKKHFRLVVTGNKQERQGIITDLIKYIEYNNFSVTESRISSIFDYLYSHYSEERMAFLKGHKNISIYDSENLTFSLLESILEENPLYSHFGILCHTPLRMILKDWTLMNEDERRYVSHYSTHIDFLIINNVTRMPVLAIETDGYNYHKDSTEQFQRDQMKNHILELYRLTLLRLSTTGSGEKKKIIDALSGSCNNLSWFAD